jgi:hypothetical protein
MKYLKNATAIFLVTLVTAVTVVAQDPGWPRKIVKPGGTLIMYQPQVDDWKDFTTIAWRQAFQLTPTGGKQVVGAVSFQGTTSVDTATRMVLFYDMNVLNTYFPSLPPASTAQMDQLLRTFIPPYVNISLDRVVAYLPKPQNVKTVELNNNPPVIFVGYAPAILLSVDGDPVLAELPHTDLKSVVNTTWPLFQDKSNSQYYLLVSNIWLTASDLHGPWSRTMNVPRDFKKLPNSGKFAEVLKAVPPPQVSNPVVPGVFYATSPAEIILFDGQPSYTAITGTQLSFAKNTDSPLFVYSATQTYYYLAAGRWFSAPSLEGPWTFASLSLPSDFANIPLASPASAIVASVPGTNEAKDAVLIAQIPTTMILNPTTAAAQAKVSYSGAPEFAPITGTSLQYATNTVDKPEVQGQTVIAIAKDKGVYLNAKQIGEGELATKVTELLDKRSGDGEYDYPGDAAVQKAPSKGWSYASIASTPIGRSRPPKPIHRLPLVRRVGIEDPNHVTRCQDT